MGTTERLKDARDERKALAVKRLLSVVMVFVVLIACYLFINSSFFSVGTVMIQGNKYISNEEVLAIVGIPGKINIFRLDTHNAKSRLVKDLRIADAEVFRKFPATVVISLKERQPYAYAATSYGFAELDEKGIILAAFKTLKQLNVPIITGVNLGNAYIGDCVDNPALQATLSYLAGLSENSLNQLSEINISDPLQIRALTINSVQIRLGTQDHLFDKAVKTNQIMDEIGNEKSLAESIDMRYATPYIKFKSN